MSTCCGPGYASPTEAIRAPREKLLYTIAIYTGTGIQKPDYLATIDADPASPTYSKVIHRLEMPDIGDELHHMGWNACSSCHDDASMQREYLVVRAFAHPACTSSTRARTRAHRAFTR
jgi:selenium-binding protein 1